jgi:hypothetical protein
VERNEDGDNTFSLGLGSFFDVGAAASGDSAGADPVADTAEAGFESTTAGGEVVDVAGFRAGVSASAGVAKIKRMSIPGRRLLKQAANYSRPPPALSDLLTSRPQKPSRCSEDPLCIEARRLARKRLSAFHLETHGPLLLLTFQIPCREEIVRH